MRFPIHIATDMMKHQFKNWMRGNTRYPFVLMLEPLHTCNLSCLGCSPERWNGDLKDRLRNRRGEQEIAMRDAGERDKEIGLERDEQDPCAARRGAGHVDVLQQELELVAGRHAGGRDHGFVTEHATLPQLSTPNAPRVVPTLPPRWFCPKERPVSSRRAPRG